MKDPWEFVAFPVSAVTAVGASKIMGAPFSEMLGLQPFAGEYVVAAAIGLVVGFIVDDMLPAYIQHTRGGGGGMDSDMGGGDMGGDDDFEF